MRKWFVLGLILILGSMPLTAQSTELGLTSYPDGVENFFAGAFPPPGVYFQNYWLFYKADQFRGGPPEPKAFVFAQVIRLIYSSKLQILGGNWGTHIVIPFIYTDLVSDPLRVNEQTFGVGNICFDPVILAWHFGDYHVTAAFEVQFPGTYDRDDLASPSRNYFTFEPILGLAWMPKWGLGVNIKMMYDFPTVNNDPLALPIPGAAQDHYHSGQSFHFDYCVDYAVRPNLRLGVAGYYYVQTTKDTADDGRAFAFGHGREFALGPAIKYDYGKFSFCVINQFEMAALNRPEGVRNWIRIWYAF